MTRSSGILAALLAVTLLGTLATVSCGGDRVSASVTHPMDPLATGEYSTVVTALRAEKYAGQAGLYPLLTLQEPSKEEVLRWKSGDALPRRAFAIVKKGPETFEAVVDTVEGKVLSWERVENVQPGLLPSVEWRFAQVIVIGNQEWQAAARERGIQDFRDIVCVPNSVGYYGIAEEEGRRLVKVVCYAPSGSTNFWGRPIEGLIAVVDLDQRRLIRLIDTGPVPIPEGPVDLSGESVGALRKPPNAITIVQPQGPSFQVDGNVVTWQKWQFHFRIDPRLGPVVSLVRYDDNGDSRSVLYQGSLSEIFIPYTDPDVGWYFRTFLDAGENGVGRLAVVLQQDLDCPSNARFFDSVFVHDSGEPYTQKNAACLFERDTGDIAWRHYEAVNGQNDVRKRVDLVLRSISAIGNYDYVFDWVFRQDGIIRVAVGASGIPQVKAVSGRTAEDNRGSNVARYGRQVAEHTVAVNHDHFFSFRLDLDVDGQQNSFIQEQLTPVTLDDQTPRESTWAVESEIAVTEETAKLQLSIERPSLWRVINENVVGPLGYPVSYQLVPKTNAISLLDPDDFPQRRAGFTTNHLWVTPHREQERYAAGTYPNQSKGGDGLPDWTSNNRPIQNTDIVLWYTLGFHHVVRTEDWPVLSTEWSEFELRPFDFFKRNPALDLPRSEGN